MTDKEICKMFDTGDFNRLARGFLITCLKGIKADDKIIEKALVEATYVFDMYSGEQLLEAYKEYYKN